MHPEAVIEGIASRLSRRAAVRIKAGLVLNTFYWGAVAAAVYVVLANFGVWPPFEFQLLALLLLAFLLVGFLRAGGVRPETPRLMAEADRRFALQERLCTAYELLAGDQESEFKGLQVRDAAAHAQRADLGSFKPGPRLEWRLRHTLLSLIFIAIILVSTGIIERIPLPARHRYLKEQLIKPVEQKEELENSGRGESASLAEAVGSERRSERTGAGRGGEGAPGEGAGDEGSDRFGAAELSTLLWSEEGELGDYRDLDDEQLLKLMQGVMERSSWSFNPRLMEELREALKSGDSDSLRNLLEELIAERNKVSPGSIRSSIERERAGDDRRASKSRRGMTASSSREGEPGAQAESGQFLGIDSLFDEVSDEWGEQGLITGSKPGEERGTEAGAASASHEGDTEREEAVKGRLGGREVLKVLVKAIPTRTPPTAEPEEVIAEYRYRAESLMERYELPPDYREYLKRYFLAIGLVEGGEER